MNLQALCTSLHPSTGTSVNHCSSREADVSHFYQKCSDLGHPSVLGVDRPVDDVEEDVGSRKEDPGVLVYGMCVDPDAVVGAGANMTGDLVILHSQLHQHPLPLHPVLFWHAVVPCCVGIHLAVAG